DHINVFPTFENYVEQFQIFVNLIEPNGKIIYCENDENVKHVSEKGRADIGKIPYTTHAYRVENGTTYLKTNTGEVAIQVFGEHNLQNLNGARLVLKELGISDAQFYEAIQTFKGASKRLELVKKTEHSVVYKDFAHSPSKLKATTKAVKDQFPNRKLIACMELHTFSSLNKTFLQEYENSMANADEAYVYFNPHTIEHKRLEALSPQQVKEAFASDNVTIFTDSEALVQQLKQHQWHNKNLLMMSSGNFDGIDFAKLTEELLGH
ncbi:MAG: glutamate ligase domain-containing protein, partial [Bacteroidia bacterium]